MVREILWDLTIDLLRKTEDVEYRIADLVKGNSLKIFHSKCCLDGFYVMISVDISVDLCLNVPVPGANRPNTAITGPILARLWLIMAHRVEAVISTWLISFFLDI